jgi:hypothetical protein
MQYLSGTGIAYPSEETEFSLVFSGNNLHNITQKAKDRAT